MGKEPPGQGKARQGERSQRTMATLSLCAATHNTPFALRSGREPPSPSLWRPLPLLLRSGTHPIDLSYTLIYITATLLRG